jgi:sentrin-specific protease 7
MTPLFELKKEDITIISSLSDPVDETHIVKPEQIQVLSTFFFNKLKSTPNYYDNIKKWVSKLPLSSKQFIILPINESLHWYCTIIHNLSHLLTTPNNEGRCTIYSFDSLGQSHEDILTPLRAFIKGYAKDHHGLDITDDQVKLQIGKVPKQPNFNECGIHVIYNVMKFITHEEEIVKFWDRASKVASQKVSSTNALAVGVKKDMNRLFLNSERVKMREKLRELLLRLQKEQIERGDVVTDVEDAEDEDEEDIVYIDAAEFNRKKLEDAAKRCEPKDNSDESKNASGRASNEGSVDAEEKADIDGMEDDNEVERKDVEEETNPNHQEAQDINIDDEETRRDYVDELSQALSRITETAASLQESQSNETQSKVTDPSSQDIELVGVEVYESSSLPVSAQPRSQPTESSQPVQNQEIQSSLEALNDPTEMEMEDDSSSGTVRKYECINLDEDDSNDRKKSKL